MKDPKGMLMRFCATHSPHHDDAAFLLGWLEPYFGIARQGSYELDATGLLDRALVRGAAGKLLGAVPVDMMAFDRQALRCEESVPGGHAFTRGGPTVIERTAVTLLKTVLHDRFLVPLELGMGSGPYHAFSETFMRSLGEPLWHAFEIPYWSGVGYDLMLSVRSLVFMAVYASIGHLMWGGQEDAHVLHPLTEVLTSCIPYGLSVDGTLLVIVE